MPRKVVKGTTENLNMLREKVDYIGFELGEVPEFLKDFEPLEYRVPKVYDETTYKVYKYVKIKDIEILITPKDRLDDLEERYKLASPLFTYMKPEANENLEKYAYFLKMINQTRVSDIQEIEKEQEAFQKEIPFDVKFANNFKWQIFYSDYADKYFMLASTNETDNSPMFYLLKKKIEACKSKSEKDNTIFVPISNEEYSEVILKKSEIEDLENYLWFFTKNWPSIYEIEDEEGNIQLQIVGETVIYDKMTSQYRIILKDKKEASQWAYELFYFPSYDGISLAPTIDSVDEDAFQTPINYEKIKIRINDSGVQSFTWDAPYKTAGIKVDNSHLLAFEDIQDIFSKMMLVKYEPMAKLVNSQEPLNIEITKAGLYYVLIQQQNDASNTLLVPVWAFYGYRSWDWIEEQGIKYGLYEQPILMINAIDGSIIDLARGY